MAEGSKISSAKIAVDPKETCTLDDQISEESSWTGYFEDFITGQKEENHPDDHHHITTYGASCLASDAASSVVEYKKTYKRDQVNAYSLPDSLPNFYKKLLNFKKMNTKEIGYDESLEDTASSTVYSPKAHAGDSFWSWFRAANA